MEDELKVILVIAITLCVTIGWLLNTWMRMRHGYPIENSWGGKVERSLDRENTQLRAENQALLEKLAKLESRTAALETIVTDGGYTVSQEIEALRDSSRPASARQQAMQ
ncbi:hypothetical protein [Novosphingobium aquimarinum]|uniref:hypothetical protein n=1 Tax=Novosphingobium aquimarinum TaxID=2682494 RepID=UPI0012EBDEFA|nr:hypothetical protein [Novosphingobium aquimarinum]